MSSELLSAFALTFDIDWAPDFCIDAVASVLVEKSLKCSFFVTHASPAVDRLRLHPDLFELGIHPNFLPNSSHGKTDAEVIDFCMKLVPEAKSVRTHALHQSAAVFHRILTQTPIRSDLSCFLNGWDGVRPNRIYYDHDEVSMLHIPYFWEDDHEMYLPRPKWSVSDFNFQSAGLRIFNFHPVYVYLNNNSMRPYEELKRKGYLAGLSKEDFAPFVNSDQPGAGSFFHSLCDFLQQNNIKTYTAGELADQYQQMGY